MEPKRSLVVGQQPHAPRGLEKPPNHKEQRPRTAAMSGLGGVYGHLYRPFTFFCLMSWPRPISVDPTMMENSLSLGVLTSLKSRNITWSEAKFLCTGMPFPQSPAPPPTDGDPSPAPPMGVSKTQESISRASSAPPLSLPVNPYELQGRCDSPLVPSMHLWVLGCVSMGKEDCRSLI